MTPRESPENRFITFEGAEGCGKSTHAGLLAERLRALGEEVVTAREPGGTPLCETIRGLLQFDKGGEPPCPAAEALLFAASRAQLVRNVIGPALARGAWVVCDRFADSTYAYQGYGRGHDLAALRSINGFAAGGVAPAMTLLLVADAETARRRVMARGGGDRFEREAAQFHERVREGFLALARGDPRRFRVVRTDVPADLAREAVWDAVREAYGL